MSRHQILILNVAYQVLSVFILFLIPKRNLFYCFPHVQVFIEIFHLFINNPCIKFFAVYNFFFLISVQTKNRVYLGSIALI
jgi:hypothetical protein